MIQRIQTIYLFLAFLVTLVVPYVFPLWITADAKDFYFMQNPVYVALFGLSTTLSLVSIFSFKRDKINL